MIDEIKNICETLGMPDNCNLEHQMSRCSGVADVNGDGKDDYVIANESFNLNNKGSMRMPMMSTVVFNGTDIRSKSQPPAAAEFFNSTGSASFRANERVIFEGEEYKIAGFIPMATCSEDGKFIFERTRTMVLLIPGDIATMVEELAADWERCDKKQYALRTKATVLEGEELEKVKNELAALEESANKIKAGLENAKKLMGQQVISIKLDELSKKE